MIFTTLILSLVASVSSLVSDDFAFHALMTHSRRNHATNMHRKLGTYVTGSTTSTSCGTYTCSSTGAGSYCTHSLTYSTTTGVFTGSITTKWVRVKKGWGRTPGACSPISALSPTPF